ncbi:uncharacterized protein LOC111022142 [Momordica charantia]|uniref:Uncharacterized protein LOC111022142 n=1 Tax=Momordica charantia TaxID=3673 RepID=A0A6J1DLT1_MOMCH|nr:uncharacterized protein LOC111022142 [Momordica charantia]
MGLTDTQVVIPDDGVEDLLTYKKAMKDTDKDKWVTNSVIEKIRGRMQVAQSRQKSYADLKRKELEFVVGERVFLPVAPVKGILRFGKKGKSVQVAYRLALPPSLAAVHNVFLVSMLRKYIHDPSHVLDPKLLLLDESLCYKEVPVKILAKETKLLRNRTIHLVKVLWRNHQMEEATWEREGNIKARYPELFDQSTFGDKSF